MTTFVPPVALPLIEEHIPDDLRRLNQWVTWRYQRRANRWTKPPFPASREAKAAALALDTADAAKVGRQLPADYMAKARVDAPATWSSFTHALHACRTERLDGVGFVLTADDPFTVIDLDKCRAAGTGVIEPWALDIMGELGSYTEVSPSGTGIRILVRGALPPGGRRHGRIEMYDVGRYVTLTGHRLGVQR